MIRTKRGTRIMQSGKPALAVLLAVLVAGPSLVACGASRSQRSASLGRESDPIPPNEPARGLIYTGLARGSDSGPCAGLFVPEAQRTSPSPDCSHGPDPAPSGVDV